MRFCIGQKMKKRLIAVFLTMALVLGHISMYSDPVLAENLERVEFDVEGHELVRAVKEAIREDTEIANDGLQLTDGETELFYHLFQGEGRLLELEPELGRPDFMVDLRIFVRLPENADPSYRMTGDEELLFLFVNYVDADTVCSVSVSRLEAGELLFEEITPVEIKGYEKWAAEEEVRAEKALEEAPPEKENHTADGKKTWVATPSAADHQRATPSAAEHPDGLTLTERFSGIATPAQAMSAATPSKASSSDGARKDSAAALMKLVVGIDDCGTARAAVSSINELKAWRDIRMDGIPYEYEDEKIAVRAVLPRETELPADAQMRVTEITEDERYEALLRKARTKLNSRIPELRLYDIGFYTLDGDFIEVSDDARVSIRFKTDLPELNGNIGIVHFAEDGPRLMRLLEAESDGEGQLAAVTFDTDGFSAIGVANGMAPSTGGTGTGGLILLGLVMMLGAVFCFCRRYGVWSADRLCNHDRWNKKE